MSTLLNKLRIDPLAPSLLLNLPAEAVPYFPGLAYHTHPQESSYPFVLLFVHSRAELEQLAPRALQALAKGGSFWVAYPKKSSGIKTDINRDAGWDVLVAAGLGAVAALSVDSTWSVLRFKPEADVARKGAYRTNQPLPRQTGPRQLEIPQEVQQLLDQHPAESAFFEGLAYTHRKEYVHWITEAKRPETRQRRLEQMLALLQEGKKGK
ncbi:YdeI/OmpD-associated family protein [Cesiribacter andamanensis]|uniref:Bacteriocin-protection, YdeI or OmpD-Associated n=1 Tax=Cesiribacter andamanensis AMV16 TaxID=1279009 RepID=M7NPZ3_9BACT|nr:YdeI/OmpD-associated family protein [Cesiribacter andamanensis]EMR03775.1 hypothetical protein ADICEAN_01113 [Cesiribacter andamanensis AMV16]